MNQFFGAILEAWEELRINRGRVILSLIGVGAAVWAMATVLALGQLMTSSTEQLNATWNGRQGTVAISAYNTADSGDPNMGGYIEDFSGDDVGTANPDANSSVTGEPRPNEFGDAALRTVESVKANIWSRVSASYQGDILAPGLQECVQEDFDCVSYTPELIGVDPSYFTIYARSLEMGRLLQNYDGQLQMNPVVVNAKMWEMLGRPDLRSYPRFSLKDDQSIAMTVVGVVKNTNRWEQPRALMAYETYSDVLRGVVTGMNDGGSLVVVAPLDQQARASEALEATLAAQLGDSWETYSSYVAGEDESMQQVNRIMTTVVSIIGGIVILLGALGLLTVSIVTVKQRVREIGIRRAMGASAKRIFFAVFLESVVATTVAGVIGVILSVLTLRLIPVDRLLDMPMPVEAMGYPLGAAFLGVLIAAGVGALAGIIPATIAVRIKPIDAIRY